MPLVTDQGFVKSPEIAFHLPADLPPGRGLALDIDNDVDVVRLLPELDRIDLIRIRFPSFADGRGFSLARQLRDRGYRGTLRAKGGLIADQYRYARQCGFDDIEIDDALIERQPEALWRARRYDQYPTYADKLQRRSA